jgi:hypothetical protein
MGRSRSLPGRTCLTVRPDKRLAGKFRGGDSTCPPLRDTLLAHASKTQADLPAANTRRIRGAEELKISVYICSVKRLRKMRVQHFANSLIRFHASGDSGVLFSRTISTLRRASSRAFFRFPKYAAAADSSQRTRYS